MYVIYESVSDLTSMVLFMVYRSFLGGMQIFIPGTTGYLEPDIFRYFFIIKKI